jgi:predicted amidohydrolase YtcJ
MVLNSRALKILGITEDARDPLGGWYGRKPGTRFINGTLYEYAQWPVWPLIYTPYRDELIKLVRDFCSRQIAMGITTVQNFSSLFSPGESSRFFKDAQLPQRIRIIPFPGTTVKGRNLSEWNKLEKHPAPLVNISGMKYLIDGTPYEQAALLRGGYGEWVVRKIEYAGRYDSPDFTRSLLRQYATHDAHRWR